MDARSVICLQNYEFLWASVLHPQRITLGVFYKLRDKERSKESAYVLVAFRFLARPFVSFVSHIARYAPSSTDKSSSLRNQKSTQPNF